MSLQVRLCSLFAGLLFAATCGVLLGGCSDSTLTAVDTPMAMNASVEAPVVPTPDDYQTADVRPAQPTIAALTMRAPTLGCDDGSEVSLTGEEAQLDFDFGNTGKKCGSLPLQALHGCVASNKHALVPAGDNVFAFSPRTRVCFHGVTISKLRVLYTAHVDKKRWDWTLPSSMKIQLDKQRKNIVLKGSYVTLKWNDQNAVPPADGKAVISANLLNGTTQVAGPLRQTTPVTNKQAVFTGNNTIPFNGVELTIDLRDAK